MKIKCLALGHRRHPGIPWDTKPWCSRCGHDVGLLVDFVRTIVMAAIAVAVLFALDRAVAQPGSGFADGSCGIVRSEW